MPINIPMLQAMKKRYGAKKGQSVYFASENSGKKSFQKGVATAKRQGVTAAHLKDLKGKKGQAMIRHAQKVHKAHQK